MCAIAFICLPEIHRGRVDLIICGNKDGIMENAQLVHLELTRSVKRVHPDLAMCTYLIAREQVFILAPIFTAILQESRRIAVRTGAVSTSRMESAQVARAGRDHVRLNPKKSGVRDLVFRHGAGLEARGTGFRLCVGVAPIGAECL